MLCILITLIKKEKKKGNRKNYCRSRPGIIQNSRELSRFEPGTFRSSVWRSLNWVVVLYYRRISKCGSTVLKNDFKVLVYCITLTSQITRSLKSLEIKRNYWLAFFTIQNKNCFTGFASFFYIPNFLLKYLNDQVHFSRFVPNTAFLFCNSFILSLVVLCWVVSNFRGLTGKKKTYWLFTILIIYMKKLLDPDWLRAVQFKCNTSAKSVTPAQITKQNSRFWLVERQ